MQVIFDTATDTPRMYRYGIQLLTLLAMVAEGKTDAEIAGIALGAHTPTPPKDATPDAPQVPLPVQPNDNVPPPPPINQAPSAPAPSSPLEFDAFGTPWDARIHQKDKNKKQDGAWKVIKGLAKKNPAFLAQVEAELKAAYPEVPAPPATPAAPPPPTSTTPPPIEAQLPLGRLTRTITGALAEKKLTRKQIDEVLVAIGGEGTLLPMLSSRPDLVPLVQQHLDILIEMAG